MKLLKKLTILLIFPSIITPVVAGEFRLTSSDITEGKQLKNTQILNGFGCKGLNLSPDLSWENAPKGTKSFVVTAYDPDAPTGSGWWHWVMANIPAKVSHLKSGLKSQENLHQIVQSRTDFGHGGYGGACPPPGKMHRYVFKVQALSVEKLEITEQSSAALIGFMAMANRLAEAKITAVYSR